MRSTQQFSITLSGEMAEAVRAKVAASEYATEGEVFREGLRVLLARDRVVEDRLRKDLNATHDKHQLGELHRHIAECRSAAVAKHHISAVIGTCEGLALFSLRGVSREDIRLGLRATHHRARTMVA